jgi:hypothetical protein
MLMVRTSDSSQCCAVAVPWAWKARRIGCEGESLGGSVVLLLLSWCLYGLGDSSAAHVCMRRQPR